MFHSGYTLRLQHEAELCRAAMTLRQYAVAILLFIMVCTGVFVLHAEPHGVVEQYRDVTRRRGHGFGMANTGSQPPVEGAERGRGTADCDGG
jgi:hypothetical protein